MADNEMSTAAEITADMGMEQTDGAAVNTAAAETEATEALTLDDVLADGTAEVNLEEDAQGAEAEADAVAADDELADDEFAADDEPVDEAEGVQADDADAAEVAGVEADGAADDVAEDTEANADGAAGAANGVAADADNDADAAGAAEAAAAEDAEADAAAPTADTSVTTKESHTAERAEQESAVHGADAAESEHHEPTFADLPLDADVLAAVKKVGFETPSPIQARTIPVLMQGRDVVGLAQTGTGKTAAFALPILSRLDVHSRRTQALILAPTRELALQVADSFQSFADHLGDIHILPIYGGQSYDVQLKGLRHGAQIVVGTPGRVIDHLERGSLDLHDLRFMVLDEADEMLTMGFQDDVERILEDTPEQKQIALFSATMPAGIRRLAKTYLDNPAEITVKSQQRTADNIRQRYLLVSHRNKLDALTRILEVTEFEAMIMFARTKQATEELAEKLRARGFSAAAINGDMVQAQRERTVDQLRDGKLDILVATDVAARGLDVERISHVVNYDIPHDTESYVHRIGRTGRAGRSGEAILFVTPRERRLLKTIEKATKSSIDEMDLPTVDEVNETRKAKFMDSITSSLEDAQVELFRGLISSYAEQHDTPLVDIAAALATQSFAGDEFLLTEDVFARERGSRFDRDGRGRGFGDADDREPDTRTLAERFEGHEAPTFIDRTGREMAVYKVSVGKRQHVRPGALVGAIANEGGLSSSDFGKISIFTEHSLVELPSDLPMEVFEALEDTRVSGKLIKIEPDPGAPAGRPASHKRRDDRDDRRGGRGFDRDRGGFDDRRGGRFDRDDRRGGRFDRDDRRGGFRGDRGGRRFDRDDRRGGFRGDRFDGDRGGRRFDRDDRRGGRGFDRDRGGFDDRRRGRFDRDDRRAGFRRDRG